MSNEPDAKRTRLSDSSSQSGAEELQRELKMLYDTVMSNFDAIKQLMPKMNQTVNTMKKLATKPLMEVQLQELEQNVTKAESDMISAQKGLLGMEHIIEDVLLDKLHTYECTESEECLLEMQRILKNDPLSLERKLENRDYSGKLISDICNRHSPLHDAIMSSHVKCAKFLLENGAQVTSLTTIENESILNSMYMYDWQAYREDRLYLLKLLLKYGVSSMIKNLNAGNYAVCVTSNSLVDNVEEASLLFYHGATMDQEEARDNIAESWEMYNLPLIKLLFLYCPGQVNIGPGSHDLCYELIKNCYRKMILVDVPLHLCHEKLLEALQLYKVFGGMFRVCPGKHSNQNLLQYLKCYKHRRHFNGVKSRIKTLISNPLSLKEISRLTVCKCIHKDYLKNIKKLDVPEDLQPFLRFDDVTITERPDDFDCGGDNVSNSDSSEYEDSGGDSEMEI